MHWITQWQAIAARIGGFIKSSELYFCSIQSGNNYYGTDKKVMLPESKAVFECIRAFSDNFQGVLPVPVKTHCDNFIAKFKDQFDVNLEQVSRNQYLALTKARVVALCSLKSEVDYLLSDTQQQIRSTVERSFLHLQRCLVADLDYKNKWGKAFENGEINCEKLGAVHLLWHGIWAFKVNASGGRTDLVLGNDIVNPMEEIQRSSLGLVLTEWKLAKNNDVKVKFDEGKKQAQSYSSGILAGIELNVTRYIIVVTEKEPQLINDEIINDITYRFINIAVDLDVPSKLSPPT